MMVDRPTECCTIESHGTGDVLAEYFVDVEHVQVYSTQLDDKGMSHGRTRTHVRLQNVAKLLDGLVVLEH